MGWSRKHEAQVETAASALVQHALDDHLHPNRAHSTQRQHDAVDTLNALPREAVRDAVAELENDRVHTALTAQFRSRFGK